MSIVRKRIPLSSVVCYATSGGHNIRNPFQFLGSDEVLFRPELHPTAEAVEGQPPPVPDQRAVLMELVFGENATEATQQDFLRRFRTSEPDIWALALNMMSETQLDDIHVVVVEGGYGLVGGARRLMAKTLGHLISPEVVDDMIDAKIFDTVDEAALNSKGLSSNLHRKAVSPVEIGKIAAQMKAAGLDYKTIATQLNIYSPAKGNKAPAPNHQAVRNYALLHDPKVTDADREAILSGEKGWTKVLQQRGLMQTTSSTANAEPSGEGKTKHRKRSKNLKELIGIFDSRKEVAKIVAKLEEKELTELEDVVRYVLMKAANVTYKPFPAEETPAADAPEGEEAAA